VREAVLVWEQRHNIQRNTFLLEELLYLFRCEQHPFPTLYKEEDACALHFAGKGTDTSHGMVGL
jgi:hypothetical protein